MMSLPAHRVLVAIPAYNEEATLGQTVNEVRRALPGFDLLVVDDGSRDATPRVLQQLDVVTATHLCNLGYGRAIQTAIKYAIKGDYDVLITLDADGQHHPSQVRNMYAESVNAQWDVLIGSRHVEANDAFQAPPGRRLGMHTFSWFVKILSGRRIYDTTSGLKVIKRRVFGALTSWQLGDLHAEAIVYLMGLGYTVGEFPVTMSARTHGASMYTAASHVTYPLKTTVLVLLGVVQAALTRRERRRKDMC
ncbi:MAG: glycosyltransferase family 2 protein [Acidobacteriota bacterium]